MRVKAAMANTVYANARFKDCGLIEVLRLAANVEIRTATTAMRIGISQETSSQ